jgi:hypothetical protein
MATAAFLLILAIGPLLVPDLRAEPAIWIISGVLVGLAVLRAMTGRRSGIVTARQVKYSRWWGYTSHDGTGERDMREKLGR